MRALRIVLAVAILACLGSTALAVSSPFGGYVDPTGNMPEPGDWERLPSGVWAQWFYNDPFDPLRWKEAMLHFDVQPDPTDNEPYAIVGINWTSDQYPPSGPGLPPVISDPGEEDMFVRRITVWEGFIPPEGYVYDGPWTDWQILVEEYNPEWVSIDLLGHGYTVNGVLDHVCVPEPGTMLMLLGALAVVGLVRRRR